VQSLLRPHAIAVLVVLASGASDGGAVQNRGDGALLAGADGDTRVESLAGVQTIDPQPPGRGVQACIDVDGIDSFDSLDDGDNVTVDVAIGDGFRVVGVAWDVGIAATAPSWLSDANVLISDSSGSNDPQGIFLAPGFDFDEPGDREFTSNGVVLFSDLELPEVGTRADGIVRLQFFEIFDDAPNAPDAAWRNASDPVVCPGIWLEIAEDTPSGPPPEPDVDPNAVPTTSLLALLLLIGLLVAPAAAVLRRTP
jgi:hypothetical protein